MGAKRTFFLEVSEELKKQIEEGKRYILLNESPEDARRRRAGE